MLGLRGAEEIFAKIFFVSSRAVYLSSSHSMRTMTTLPASYGYKARRVHKWGRSARRDTLVEFVEFVVLLFDQRVHFSLRTCYFILRRAWAESCEMQS